MKAMKVRPTHACAQARTNFSAERLNTAKHLLNKFTSRTASFRIYVRPELFSNVRFNTLPEG